MASITIRNLDDDLKRRLRVQAAEHGQSMEAEVLEILRHAVGEPGAPKNLGAPRKIALTMRRRYDAMDGLSLGV